MYRRFSHLRTTYFIRKNTNFPYTFFSYTCFSYTFFSYTFFLLEHNGVLLEHNEVLLEHNGVFSEHNEVLLEHNEVFLEQNAGWDGQKYEENDRILHNLACVYSKSIKIEHGPAISIDCLDLYPK